MTTERASRRWSGTYIRRRIFVWSLRGLLLGTLLGSWAYATRDGGFSSLILPSIGDVGDEFVMLFGTTYLLGPVGVTVMEIIVAFAIAAVVGLAVGYLLSRSVLWSDVAEPMLTWAYMFPLVLLYPIFLLWLGVGIWATIAYAATVAVIPITYNSLRGLRNVEWRYLQVGRAFGASPNQVDVHIKSGSARPLIQSGLRVGFSLVLISVILAQLLGANEGIGHEIQSATDTMQNALAFAMVILLIVVVAIVQRVLEAFLKPVQR